MSHRNSRGAHTMENLISTFPDWRLPSPRGGGGRAKANTAINLASAVFNSTQEAIVVTDTKGIIIAVNPAFTVVTGYSALEVVGKNMRSLQSGRQCRAFYRQMWEQVSKAGHWQGEIWNRRKNGEIYPALLTISSVRNTSGKTTHYVGSSADLSRVKKSELKLDHFAHHDELTGLPNRRLLSIRLEQAVARAIRDGSHGAVIFVDLDRFKLVGRTAMFRRHRDTDGGRDRNELAVDRKRLLECRRDTMCQKHIAVGLGRKTQNGEFVAAETGQKVIAPESRRQPLGHSLNELVAGLMPQRIVDVLEPIDVDVSRDRARPARSVIERRKPRLHFFDHMLPIGETGKRVMPRSVTRPRLALREFTRRALQAAEHMIGQHARREHATGYQRQDDGEQNSPRPLCRPREIPGRCPIVSDKGL